jgi:hypothetical protein
MRRAGILSRQTRVGKGLPTYGAFAAAALLLMAVAPAHAEQFVEQDGFRVHYAAIPTTDVAPDTARAFGISRSRRQALLVLNAQQLGDGPLKPVAATATGTARNLLGHMQRLALRPVQEGEVHYVIATFEILNQEWLTFEVAIQPDGAARAIPLKFQQQFYAE